ncbi:MAG: dihydropyrimidinase [Phycisphaerales bacterium]|nr:MAG: dihydropyrimidinase [Phycisphaerales bacterium]
MTYDTIIQGGTIHAASHSYVGDIAISGEKIAAVSGPGTLKPTGGTKTINAKGKEVIPGCIDVHVHLELPFMGSVSCDDFDSGSKAAASGCITTVIDFAAPGKGESLKQAHETWMAKAEGKSLVDYSWHMCIVDDQHLKEIPQLIKMGLPTFKEFMIYASMGWQSDDARLFESLELMHKHDGMLLVHAESSRVLDLLIERNHTQSKMRKYGARLHTMTRPNYVEAEAIERAIRWCEVTGGTLYIVHMSTGEGADLVKTAQARGVNVWSETCTHYLVLDDSVFAEKDGHLYACQPQVKKDADIRRLWRALDEGDEISVVSTDTCSFTRKQKAMWKGDWTKIPMGLPGLDTMVPIMYTHGVRAGRISMNRLVELCSTNPAKIMGMGGRKGQIAPGYDADIAIIDPHRTVKIDHRKLQSRCDWSPYQGQQLGGFAHTTLVRGTVIVENHKVIGANGHGKFIKRQAPGSL